MYRLVRAALFLLPAETAHHVGLFCLRLLGTSPAMARRVRRGRAPAGVDLSVAVAGLRFPNPVGLAAGFDKDAVAVEGLFALGFGSVEVGTLTPRSQPGNPTPRLFRLPEHQALINRLGFNNHGAAAAAARLQHLAWRPGPVGVNVGKNKDTPNEHAAEDYVACIDQIGKWGDYLVVNASSPNTPGLRSLQEPEALRALLRAVRAAVERSATGKPLFLKIAPDLTAEAARALVDVVLEAGLDGLIATNTTVDRPVFHARSGEAGGLSGHPLRPLSTQMVRAVYDQARGRLPIIGVGGIFTGEDAYEKIRAGASLVQLYTGFIYGGPGVVGRILAELAGLLRRDGFHSVSEAVGADHRLARVPAR